MNVTRRSNLHIPTGALVNFIFGRLNSRYLW